MEPKDPKDTPEYPALDPDEKPPCVGFDALMEMVLDGINSNTETWHSTEEDFTGAGEQVIDDDSVFE